MKKLLSSMALAAMMAVGSQADDAKETAFLGITTRNADRTICSQLDIPKGMGLVVSAVVPESPAEGTIKVDDILTKFDQQLLVNPEQLGVLVRAHNPGDNVTVEAIRKGKPNKLPVTLGSRLEEYAELAMLPANIEIMSPVIEAFSIGDDGNMIMMDEELDPVALKELIIEELSGANIEEYGVTAEQISNMMEGVSIDLSSMNEAEAFGHACAPMVSTISSMMFDEDTGNRLSYTLFGEKATLQIIGNDGKKIFDGPVNTAEEKAKVPEKYRETFHQMLKIEGGCFTLPSNGAMEGNSVPIESNAD